MSISILIVDDHRSYAKSLALALTGFGFNTSYAINPEGAFSLVSKQKFDVLIIDFDMPEVKGDEMAQKLDEIQIIDQKILISGFDLRKANEDYKFDMVMSKPLDMYILEEMLNELNRIKKS